jgi:small subunit ribosomal protein S17
MFRRKKKEEETSTPPSAETAVTSERAPAAEVPSAPAEVSVSEPAIVAEATDASAADAAAPVVKSSARRGNRVQKVGIVASDKMQKTVVVRVDRLVLHQRYRRYVRRTSKFKAHDDLGSAVGDRVRIVETRPLSAQKHWRVVEILQKAAK